MYNLSRKGTWTKFRYPRSGWGAWVDGKPNMHEHVILKTKAGKMTLAEVTEIVKPAIWPGDRTLVEIGETCPISEILEDEEDADEDAEEDTTTASSTASCGSGIWDHYNDPIPETK